LKIGADGEVDIGVVSGVGDVDVESVAGIGIVDATVKLEAGTGDIVEILDSCAA